MSASDWDEVVAQRRREQSFLRATSVLTSLWPDEESIRWWAAIAGLTVEEVEAILATCRGKARRLRLNRRSTKTRGQSRRSFPKYR